MIEFTLSSSQVVSPEASKYLRGGDCCPGTPQEPIDPDPDEDDD